MNLRSRADLVVPQNGEIPLGSCEERHLKNCWRIILEFRDMPTHVDGRPSCQSSLSITLLNRQVDPLIDRPSVNRVRQRSHGCELPFYDLPGEEDASLEGVLVQKRN